MDIFREATVLPFITDFFRKEGKFDFIFKLPLRIGGIWKPISVHGT